MTEAESAAPTRSPQPDIRLLELQRTVAQARVQSLEVRRAADGAKFAAGDGQEVTAPAKQLAQAAAGAERRLNTRQAELNVHRKRTVLRAAESSEEQDETKKQAAINKAKKELTDAEKKLADAEKKLKVQQEALAQTGSDYTPLGKQYPRTSSGRRLALARWIASRDNPLTARVAVNHIWLRHFGTPLVDNVFDFGLRSPRPRHADLLDWLAVELMENDWSMKHLHRLVVSSRVWRLASSAGKSGQPRNLEVDKDNHYLWRTNVRRLEAEVIRDSILAVSVELDTTVGGADVDFRRGESSRRRSIYLQHAYEKQMTLLVLFDAASPLECYRRSESIVPQQALALTNSSLSLGQSRLLARRLWQETADDGDQPRSRFIRSAFLQILSRPPDDEERAACLEFLADQAATLSDTSKLTTFAGGSAPKIKPAADAHQRARENLVHVLMNHNDFVTCR